MCKIFLVVFTIALFIGAGAAQQTSGQTTDTPPNMGRAPKQMNGVGRLDLRVSDSQGNPVQGAFAQLESRRTDGYFCEAFSYTDARGVALDQFGRPGMPPLHMGALKLIVKAKGYETFTMDVPHNALSEPVRVTLIRKS